MTISVPVVNGDVTEVVETEVPEALPVLPLRDSVAFPEMMMPLAVGQERSIQLVDDVLGGNRMLVMVASKEPEAEEPGPEQLYNVGVVGVVARMMKVPDGSVRILVQCGQRVELGDYVATSPYLVARVTVAPDEVEASEELEGLRRNVQATFSRIIEDVPYLPEELQLAVANIDDPSELAHLIAGALRVPTEEKQQLLEERDVTKRLRRLSEILARELELVEIGSRIQTRVQSEMESGQREYFLRQQLRAIQEELGEVDEQQAETQELRKQLEEAGLPERVWTVAERELGRFERLPPQAAEHGVIRGYLEWLASLPWSKSTEDNLDLKHARSVLDRDHYDIERVKDRILEFLAVRKLNPEARSSIVLFVGPPGVGKTSLGRSIASAMERDFERISVGGVRDESEIRGHRRTYIGAMPGTIVRALRDAGSNNPVLMIDEIDKMGADFRGDPASAMLEVLDPEQNSSFRDHYLDVPVDLSNVFFICTANQRRHDPAGAARPHGGDRALGLHARGEARDREALPGAAADGAERGRASPRSSSPSAALDRIIDGYTREAGRAPARARDRLDLPQGRARVRGGDAPLEAHDPPRDRDRAARQAALPARGEAAHERARRGDRAGLDAGRRRRAVRRGDRLPGRRQAPDHGPARRRDEGVRRGGALIRARARAATCRPSGSRSTTSTCTCPPARSRRTARAPASPWPPRSPRA